MCRVCSDLSGVHTLSRPRALYHYSDRPLRLSRKMWNPVNLTSGMFYVFSHKSSQSKLKSRCIGVSVLWRWSMYVNLDHRFTISAYVFNLSVFFWKKRFSFSPLQPLTWAATGVRSQTCWIKAFRSAHSVLSSRPTIDSSCCAAFGTRASGFIPLTRVWLHYPSTPQLEYNQIHLKKSVELQLFKTVFKNIPPCIFTPVYYQ